MFSALKKSLGLNKKATPEEPPVPSLEESPEVKVNFHRTPTETQPSTAESGTDETDDMLEAGKISAEEAYNAGLQFLETNP